MTSPTIRNFNLTRASVVRSGAGGGRLLISGKLLWDGGDRWSWLIGLRLIYIPNRLGL